MPGSLSRSPFVGFVPWIVFSVVAKDVGWEVAATAGLVSSAILSYPSFERGNLKILDYAGFIFFAALVVLGLFLDRSELNWVEEYSTVISMGAIAVVVFASLSFVPFTEQYARETVPKDVQETASYKRTNRHLTTVWGLVFTVVALDALIQQVTDSSSALLDWIIPVGAIVAGFKYNAYYVAKVRAAAQGRGAGVAA